MNTHNDMDVDTNGTHLVGYIETSYGELVRHFGEPHSADEYKVDAEWDVEFEDGSVATIYNYKDGRNYNGPAGNRIEDITHWHIGGHVVGILFKMQEIMTPVVTPFQPGQVDLNT